MNCSGIRQNLVWLALTIVGSVCWTACPGPVDTDDDDNDIGTPTDYLYPPKFNPKFASHGFKLPPGKGPTDEPMPACEAVPVLHMTGPRPPFVEQYNIRLVDFFGAADAYVEDPSVSQWGWFETGPVEFINWESWHSLYLAVNFGVGPKDPLPIRFFMRMGGDFATWQAASMQEMVLVPDDTPPWGTSGYITILPPETKGASGPFISFRMELMDDGTMDNHYVFFAARWNRAYIPEEDFFETHVCE